MNTFLLKSRVGWGNEIHIETTFGTYAGSGRCCLSKSPYGIVYRKPSLDELKDGSTVSGHCSTPYVKNGDALMYETDEGQEIKMIFKKIRYSSDPTDLFFGELKLVDEKRYPLIYRIKKIFHSPV